MTSTHFATQDCNIYLSPNMSLQGPPRDPTKRPPCAAKLAGTPKDHPKGALRLPPGSPKDPPTAFQGSPKGPYKTPTVCSHTSGGQVQILQDRIATYTSRHTREPEAGQRSPKPPSGSPRSPKGSPTPPKGPQEIPQAPPQDSQGPPNKSKEGRRPPKRPQRFPKGPT